jgi:ornithine cyclodeaminase
MSWLRLVDAEAVHRHAPWVGLVDALHAGHLGERPLAGHCRLMQERADGQPDYLMVASAWDKGRAMGVKLVTSFPMNQPRHGLPTVDAIYVLFDPETGRPRTVLDGEALIFRKTAADTALGVRLLAPENARRLLMVGAGALAPYLIEAVRAVRPGIEEIRIWNRTPHRAELLAARFAGHGASVCRNLDDDLGRADIVIAATMATEPLVRGDALKAGAHVGLVGSFTPEMREGDDALLRRAAIHVDSRDALEKSGEFTGPLARGVIAPSDVRGDLFDLCQGKVAPSPADQVTLFKNASAAHLDLITATFVASNLSASGPAG